MLNDESGNEPLGPRPGQFSRAPPAHTTATTATTSATSTSTSTTTMRAAPEAAGAGRGHRPASCRPGPSPAAAAARRAAAVRTPPSAFFHRSPAATRLSPLAVSLFLALALCIFVVCGRAAANAHSEHRSHPPATGRGLGQPESDAEPTSKFVSAHRPPARHQRDRDRLRRDQLKYLIARTSSGPHLGGRAPLERPLQLYKQHQRRDSHADNEIDADSNLPGLPESVLPPTTSQAAAGAGRAHRKHADRPKPPAWPDDFDFDELLGRDAFGRARARGDQDVDDDDDEGDSDDEYDDDDYYGAEGDDEGDENGAGGDDDDADDADDADPDEEAPDPADDDLDLDADEQNSIPLDEPRTTKARPKGANRKLPHPLPWPARSRERPAQAAELGNSIGDGPRGPRAGGEHRDANRSESPPWWGRARFYERPEPALFTTASPGQLEALSRRQQPGRPPHRRPRKHMSQPRAPYQSPVVVSISDNSFVSASPVGSGADGTNESPRPDRAAAVRYSHIVAGPKNELSLPLGRKGWHDAHIASIHMVQEEPNELRRGGIPSAIIAILFGIGVTGMLIMIVSIKLRSIRERVAYKGRRRSLVPDTDFLINTMPT